MACYDAGDYICTYDSGDVGAGCGGGGCDYTVLATWESASDNDLTGTGITPLDCFDSQNHNDSVLMNGATNEDETHYRVIRSAAGCSTPFAGKAGTGANFVCLTDSIADTFRVHDAHHRVEQLCIRYNATNGNNGNHNIIHLSGDDSKALHCVLFDSINNYAGQSCVGIKTIANNCLVYACIIYNCQGNGVGLGVGVQLDAGTGETAGVVCCSSIDNKTDGFRATTAAGTSYAWSCYAADNPVNEFLEANWDDNTLGWNSSLDATSDLGLGGDNYKNTNDLTDFELDGDYLALESIDWAGGAGDNAGRNPVNDLSGAWDPETFFTAPDTLFYKSIEGNDRPAGDDSAWDVGASEYIAATSAAPTSAAPTTAAPTSTAPTTAAPTSAAPTSAAPTTSAPTSAAPTTQAPTTVAPTTAAPTTAEPTQAPTTAAPTSAAPTTAAPTTAAPTTSAPTTAAPTTAAPTTTAPTTAAPTTTAPTTGAPTTAAPTTAPPCPEDCSECPDCVWVSITGLSGTCNGEQCTWWNTYSPFKCEGGQADCYWEYTNGLYTIDVYCTSPGTTWYIDLKHDDVLCARWTKEATDDAASCWGLFPFDVFRDADIDKFKDADIDVFIDHD